MQWILLLHNFQDLHGASLGADAAGDALGGKFHILSLDHDAKGASFHALAAANAELLVDHVNALGVLGNCTVLAGSSTLAALDANHGLRHALTVYDLDAGLIGMELFVESIGTGADTFQTCHTFRILLDSEFLHNRGFPFFKCFV